MFGIQSQFLAERLRALANTWTAVQTFANTGLHIFDTNDSHDLILKPGSDLTADRTLTLTTGDADRTVTINAATTLSGTNTGDQTITLTGDVTGSGTGSFAATVAATHAGTAHHAQQSLFETIAVAGQSNVVADSATDTLTLAAGSNVTITTDATTDTVTIAATGTSGANTALSNLAAVAINLPLLPDVAAADDFGSATLPFKDIFLAGSSGTPGTNNFRITGASTSGTRVITIPDATETLVGRATTDTLTNKTLTAPAISQVVFPATQAASADANTLDDYEEGAWTPAIADDTLDGTGEGQTYATQLGTYTKVGRKVHFEGRLVMTSLGTLTAGQQARIVGLPFTASTTTTTGVAFGWGDLLAVTAGQSVTGHVSASSTRVNLWLWDAAAGVSLMTLTEVSADGDFLFSGEYTV